MVNKPNSAKPDAPKAQYAGKYANQVNPGAAIAAQALLNSARPVTPIAPATPPIPPKITVTKYSERVNTVSQKEDMVKNIEFERVISTVVAPFAPPASKGGLDSSALMYVEHAAVANVVEPPKASSTQSSKVKNLNNYDTYHETSDSSSMMSALSVFF